MGPFQIRTARPDELEILIAVDDDSAKLYAESGLRFSLEADHPFVVAESSRWAVAIERKLAHVAVDSQDNPVGFITLGFVDGHPYLDQLAVLSSFMRRGIGSALLRKAISWSGERSLWLTTYSHLNWNKPYYERHGFVTVPEHKWGSELSAIIQEQRTSLPESWQRVAMVRTHDANGA